MATIKDICAACGVSAGAVSRILNNDPYLCVSDETRKKVLDTAAALGYRKKHNFTIGIVQWFSMEQEIEDSYYLYIRHGIEDFCHNNNISVIRVFKSDYFYTESLKEADALICVGKFAPAEVKQLSAINRRILFIDMDIDDDSISTINLDYKKAMFAALDYLVENNHKKIGFLGGKEYLEGHVLYKDYRRDYFEEYCITHNIEYKDYIKIDRFSGKSGYDMMLALIRSKNVPTAIFAASDPIAIGAMRALSDRGYKVPEDVSIIGFDNTEASAYTTPPLTTVHTPSYHMGSYGAGIIYHLLNNKDSAPIKIKLPCSLVIRESVTKN